jgi:hypothetical protein
MTSLPSSKVMNIQEQCSRRLPARTTHRRESRKPRESATASRVGTGLNALNGCAAPADESVWSASWFPEFEAASGELLEDDLAVHDAGTVHVARVLVYTQTLRSHAFACDSPRDLRVSSYSCDLPAPRGSPGAGRQAGETGRKNRCSNGGRACDGATDSGTLSLGDGAARGRDGGPAQDRLTR